MNKKARAKHVHGRLGERRRREIRHAIIDARRVPPPVIAVAYAESPFHVDRTFGERVPQDNRTKTLALTIAAALIGVPALLLLLYLSGI